MQKYILRRLKAAAAAVGLAVGTAFIEAVDAQLIANLGIGIPVAAKLGAIGAISAFFVNFTDNVDLVEDGTAVVAKSLPAPVKVLGPDTPQA
jgi:hypothetical protein